MRVILFFIFYSFLSLANAQNENIDYIHFEYGCSHKAFSNVQVFISKNFDRNNYIKINVKYYEYTTEKTKELKVKRKEFDEIIKQFYKINNSDLLENLPSVLDPCSTTLITGKFLSNNISYELEGLHKNQVDTALKDFIITIQMILKVAELEIDSFN